jgi:N-acetylneuraminic acid mutarotase
MSHKNKISIVVISLLLLTIIFSTEQAFTKKPALLWKELPQIPDSSGFAGMYLGVSNRVLIAAGGANFPYAPPSEGGKKVWYDNIYILESPKDEWRILEQKLPHPMAYGLSITWNNKLFLIGGGNAERHFREVYTLEWDGEKIIQKQASDLPEEVAFTGGTIQNGVIYVVGGRKSPDANKGMDNFWSLKLSKNLINSSWKILNPWPGPARWLPVVGSQCGDIQILSGAAIQKDTDDESKRILLSDAYSYDPQNDSWKNLPDMPEPRLAAPSPAPEIGDSILVIVGGVSGNENKNHIPGFTKNIIGYDCSQNRWIELGELPKYLKKYDSSKSNERIRPVVTAPTAVWYEYTIILNGEIRAGVRTPKVIGLKKNPY